MSLSISDLALIIPLVEKELDSLHEVINGSDEAAADDAADIATALGNTSAKLEELYTEQRKDGSNYPSYKDLIG